MRMENSSMPQVRSVPVKSLAWMQIWHSVPANTPFTRPGPNARHWFASVTLK